MTNSQRWNTIIPYSHKMQKRWAADLRLLPILGNIQLGLAGHQDFLHGNIQQFAECIQVVNGGQALALLPFVDRLRFFKTKPALQVSDGHTTILAQTGNVFPGCRKINDWKCLLHCRSSVSVGDTTEYRIFQNNASSNFTSGGQYG